MEVKDLIVGEKYNWINQPERLVYLGFNFSGNGYWHQFAKANEPNVVWCEVLDFEIKYFERTTGENKMNARDKTYTGNVSEWGLPDGTVVVWVLPDGRIAKTGGDCFYKKHHDFLYMRGNEKRFVNDHYKIKSLPDGYEFNEQGEIVKFKQKHYWDGKEPLEIGMWFIESIHQSCVQAAYINGLDVAFDYKDGLGACSINSCKPIDTRTDKQKAVDSLPMYATNSLLANDIIDAIISGEVYGVKWVGKDA